MIHLDNGLRIPTPSPQAYEMGLELSSTDSVPEQFRHIYRNGIHALAAAIGDLGLVRSIANTPFKPSYLEMQRFRNEMEPDNADLRLIGEGLLVLIRDRHDIAAELKELSPGMFMTPINDASGINLMVETNSQYTEIIVTDRVRTQRTLDGGLLQSLVTGHEIYVDRPQEPGTTDNESRVRLLTFGASKISDGVHEALMPVSPYIQPNALRINTAHLDDTLWAASELLIGLSSNL